MGIPTMDLYGHMVNVKLHNDKLKYGTTLCMVYGILNHDMFYTYIYFKIENVLIINFMKWNIIVIEIVSSQEIAMYCTQWHNKSNLS